jgi:hypothetical protein
MEADIVADMVLVLGSERIVSEFYGAMSTEFSALSRFDVFEMVLWPRSIWSFIYSCRPA